MLEIANSLPYKKISEVENFLTYLGIYDDLRREKALKSLLKKEQHLIKGKIGVEAGAGLGRITEFLIKLGAKKVYAIEENNFCIKLLKEKFKKQKNIEVIYDKVENFSTNKKIDFLFQELYGPLLLDENLLALNKLKFRPEVVLPNQGYLLVEEINLKDLKDPTIDKQILDIFRGILVTDLFLNFKFKNPKILGSWQFGEKRDYNFRYKVKQKKDVIAFGIEIRHNNRRIIGTEDSFNWPFVFTPKVKDVFELSFSYSKDYTKVYFNWIR